MLTSGIEKINNCTRKHIHRQLVAELGSSVQIFPNDKRKLLMVPDSVTLRDVVVENQILQREVTIWKDKLTDSNKILDQATTQMNQEIGHGLGMEYHILS